VVCWRNKSRLDAVTVRRTEIVKEIMHVQGNQPETRHDQQDQDSNFDNLFVGAVSFHFCFPLWVISSGTLQGGKQSPLAKRI
jgi:hypothetical protein